MTKYLREPLFHFILIGALLFAGHSWLPGEQAGDKTIHLSLGDMERIVTLWAAETGRAPSDEDIRALVADHVQEEVLVREARALGLDAGDTIVRRRLAQKMGFFLSDVTRIPEPEESALQAWFDNNRPRYDWPERRAFSHVYFSPQARGQAIEADAALTRARLQAGEVDWQAAGDPFMLQRDYEALDRVEVERLFGRAFSQGLFELGEGEWTPVGSAFGLHLVRIDMVTPFRETRFQAVRDQVLADYLEAERQSLNAQAIIDLVAKYDVVIEEAAP